MTSQLLLFPTTLGDLEYHFRNVGTCLCN